MAVEKKLNKDDDNGIPQVGAIPMGQGVPTGTSVPQQRPTTSSRFATLQKYLGANVPAGERMAGAIGTKATREITKGQDEARKQADAVKSGIQAGQQSLSAGQGFVQKIRGEDFRPEDFVDQPEFAQFQSIQQGMGLSDDVLRNQLAQAQIAQQQALQKADTQRRGLQTQSGRFDLLRKAYGVTPGQVSGLDVALLQTGRGGEELRKLQQNLAGQAQGLEAEAGQVTRLGRQAEKLQQEESDVMSGLQGAITGVTGRTEQAYQQQLKDYLDSVGAEQGALSTALTSGALTPEQLQKLGLSELAGQRVYDIPLEQYLKGTAEASLENVLGGSDIKRIEALRKIAGQPDFMGQVKESKQEGFSPYGFDVDAFKAAQKPYEEAYQQVWTDVKNIGENKAVLSGLGNVFAELNPELRTDPIRRYTDSDDPWGGPGAITPEEAQRITREASQKEALALVRTPGNVTGLLDRMKKNPRFAYLSDIMRSNPNTSNESIRDSFGIHSVNDQEINAARRLAQLEAAYKQIPGKERTLGKVRKSGLPQEKTPTPIIKS